MAQLIWESNSRNQIAVLMADWIAERQGGETHAKPPRRKEKKKQRSKGVLLLLFPSSSFLSLFSSLRLSGFA
jgi:hypothetical protein